MSRQYYAIQNYKKQIAELKARLKKENKMEVERAVTIEIKLTLAEVEARWLRSVCQNPINCITPEDEHADDAKMRRVFFDAISESGIN